MAPFLLKNCIGKYVELHSWKSSVTDAKMWQWLVILGYKITRGIVFLFFPYVLSISFCLKNSFIFFKKKKEASYIIKEKNPIWWTVFDTHATFPTSLYRSSTSCLSLRPVSSLRKYLAGDSRRAELFCEGWGPLGGPPPPAQGPPQRSSVWLLGSQDVEDHQLYPGRGPGLGPRDLWPALGDAESEKRCC